MAGEVWTLLPAGKDVNVKAGYYYAAIAALKKNHSATDVHNLLASRGLQEQEYIDDYQGETNPEGSNYRLVVAMVYAPKDAGVLPWGVPSPASLIDSSHLVRVYAAPMKKGLPPTPPAAPSASEFPWAPVIGVAGVGGAGALLWWWLRSRHGKKGAKENPISNRALAIGGGVVAVATIGGIAYAASGPSTAKPPTPPSLPGGTNVVFYAQPGNQAVTVSLGDTVSFLPPLVWTYPPASVDTTVLQPDDRGRFRAVKAGSTILHGLYQEATGQVDQNQVPLTVLREATLSVQVASP